MNMNPKNIKPNNWWWQWLADKKSAFRIPVVT